MAASPPSFTLPSDLPAGAYTLGAPSAHFASRGAGCVLVSMGYLVMLMGVLFLWAGYKVITDPQTARADQWIGYAVAACVGLPVLLTGLWLRKRFVLLGTMQAWIMPLGIAWRSRGRKGSSRWEDIVKLYVKLANIYRNGTLVRETKRYTIVDKTGQSGLFSEFMPGIQELASKLEQEITAHHLPDAQNRFQAGEMVMFDKLRLDKTGVYYEARSLPWPELQSITVQDGALVILKVGQASRWASIPLAEIPNVAVFRALVETELAKLGSTAQT